MKFFKNKLIFIVIWLLFSNYSNKSEWYIEIPTNDGVITRVPRDMYLEFEAMLNGFDNPKFTESYYNKLLIESQEFSKSHKN